MPQSLANLYIHLIFSTKERAPCLSASVRPDLHAYLATVLANLNSPAVLINSVADHVHLVVSLKPTHMISKVLQELKKASSVWVHEEMHVPEFAWQDGYAAFTVSASVLPEVVAYVRGQEEHHRTRSFREELEIMLKKSGVNFEPKYLE